MQIDLHYYSYPLQVNHKDGIHPHDILIYVRLCSVALPVTLQAKLRLHYLLWAVDSFFFFISRTGLTDLSIGHVSLGFLRYDVSHCY